MICIHPTLRGNLNRREVIDYAIFYAWPKPNYYTSLLCHHFRVEWLNAICLVLSEHCQFLPKLIRFMLASNKIVIYTDRFKLLRLLARGCIRKHVPWLPLTYATPEFVHARLQVCNGNITCVCRGNGTKKQIFLPSISERKRRKKPSGNDLRRRRPITGRWLGATL